MRIIKEVIRCDVQRGGLNFTQEEKRIPYDIRPVKRERKKLKRFAE